MRMRGVAILYSLLATAALSAAPPPPAPVLKHSMPPFDTTSIKWMYYNSEFEAIDSILSPWQSRTDVLDFPHGLFLCKYLGVVHLALNKRDEGLGNLRKLLQMDSKASLDALGVSASIEAAFVQLKGGAKEWEVYQARQEKMEALQKRFFIDANVKTAGGEGLQQILFALNDKGERGIPGQIEAWLSEHPREPVYAFLYAKLRLEGGPDFKAMEKLNEVLVSPSRFIPEDVKIPWVERIMAWSDTRNLDEAANARGNE